MNNVYLYEGGFFSFLSLLCELIKTKKNPDDIKEINCYQKRLFDQEIYLLIKNERENIEQICKRLDRVSTYMIDNVFLSNHEEKEMIIYRFFLSYLKYGNKVFCMRRIDDVNNLIILSKRVRREAHKLKGFLRFQKMKNDFYYGEISPDNNVIGILADHFKKRLAEDNWIIKDTVREIYAIYDKKEVLYLTKEEVISLNIEKTEEEKEIEDLWKSFHKTIAISSRENRRCQQNFMPKKYWKNMLEMENEK